MPRLSLRSAALLALLILILGCLQWRIFRAQLTRAGIERDLLREQLQAASGPEKGADPAAGGRAREAAVTAGRELAKRLLEVEARLKQMRDQALNPDPGLLADERRLNNEAALQSAEGLRAYLEALQQTGDLTDPQVLYLISRAFMELADRNPEAALALLTRPQPGLTRQIIDGVATRALQGWALRSPEKAAAWLKERLATEPGFLSSQSMIQLSMGISGKDPAVALTLMREHLNPYLMVSTLLGDSEIDPTELRTRKQAVAREYLLSLPPGEPRDQAAHTYYQKFFRSVGEGQFEEARAQLEQDPLGKAELAGLFDTFQSRDLRGDQGKWLDWVAAREPLKDFAGFSPLMVNWIVRDAPGAVAWIQQTPDQEARTIALERYATWAQILIPQQAEALAVLLPEGEARTAILQQAFDRWPAEDGEGKAAFAKKHGLK